MLLRDHPLMSYRGIRNWPPAWTWIDGREDKHPKGEIGILRTVLFSKRQPANRCVLLIFYQCSQAHSVPDGMRWCELRKRKRMHHLRNLSVALSSVAAPRQASKGQRAWR